MERLRKKYWTEYDKVMGEIWTPVNIENIFMVFAILGSGFLVAIIILSAEKIVRLNGKFKNSESPKKIFTDPPGATKFAAADHFNNNFRNQIRVYQ